MARNTTVVLNISCDVKTGIEEHDEEGYTNFQGDTKAEALQAARDEGWRLFPRGLSVCPACASKKKG